MKKQNETEEIISIDLDEEKQKEEKQQQVEITAGDMYIRIPADRRRVKEAIAFLQVFEKQLPNKEPQFSQPRPQEQLSQIDKEIQETKQFLTETEQQQAKIMQKLGIPNQPMPIQQTYQENETILNQHPTFDKCPKCNGKLKRKKIQQYQDGLKQVLLCRNRKCRWTYFYLIKL